VPGTRGFGLMQRDRAFASYEDLEARYDLRPEPVGRADVELGPGPRRAGADPDAGRDQRQHRRVLGAGRGAEGRGFRDGVFVPAARAATPSAGRRPAWVAQSRRGAGFQALPDDVVKFNIDFEGPALAQLPPGTDVEADLYR
jgi:periplasmic glucans biosynthesis protein